MNVLVTGSEGFVGKNLISVLIAQNQTVTTFNTSNTIDELVKLTRDCDAVVHLAGVNRPKDISEFYKGNTDLTRSLCEALEKNANKCPIILSSSIQAEKDNDYGKSKKMAEDALVAFGKKSGNPIYIFRFKNLYGKWSRPNYNSVVATWCYNVARDLDITVDSPEATIELCYIDDVVEAIISKLPGSEKSGFYEVKKTDKTSLKDLLATIQSFKASRESKLYPDQSTYLHRNLYATYLNYLPTNAFSYPLDSHQDQRGSFTEILRSETNGQISVNVSKPGITKGQHWHSTKSEKFLVVSGSGVIQLRDFFSTEIIEYPVSGEKLEVVDIPTGYVHNLINKGDSDMVTLIWANELFTPEKQDTNYQEV